MNKDMYLIRAVEMAAIAAYKFIGRKDKNAIDGAAVQAMKKMLEPVWNLLENKIK